MLEGGMESKGDPTHKILEEKNRLRSAHFIDPHRDFLQRAPSYYFSQPGLDLNLWFRTVHLPESVTNVAVRDTQERTTLNQDLTESEVWLEGTSISTPLCFKGLYEDNFWDFVEERWDQGDTLRITSGCLMTSLMAQLCQLSHCEQIKGTKLIEYEYEDAGGAGHPFDDTFGLLKQVQQPEKPVHYRKSRIRKGNTNNNNSKRAPVRHVSFTKSPSSKSQKKVDSRERIMTRLIQYEENLPRVKVSPRIKKKCEPASFHWRPAHIRQYTYTRYFACEDIMELAECSTISNFNQHPTRKSLIDARTLSSRKQKRTPHATALGVRLTQEPTVASKVKAGYTAFSLLLKAEARKPKSNRIFGPRLPSKNLFHVFKELKAGLLSKKSIDGEQSVSLARTSTETGIVEHVECEIPHFITERADENFHVSIPVGRKQSAVVDAAAMMSKSKEKVASILNHIDDSEIMRRIGSLSSPAVNMQQAKRAAREKLLSLEQLLREQPMTTFPIVLPHYCPTDGSDGCIQKKNIKKKKVNTIRPKDSPSKQPPNSGSSKMKAGKSPGNNLSVPQDIKRSQNTPKQASKKDKIVTRRKKNDAEHSDDELSVASSASEHNRGIVDKYHIHKTTSSMEAIRGSKLNIKYMSPERPLDFNLSPRQILKQEVSSLKEDIRKKKTSNIMLDGETYKETSLIRARGSQASDRFVVHKSQVAQESTKFIKQSNLRGKSMKIPSTIMDDSEGSFLSVSMGSPEASFSTMNRRKLSVNFGRSLIDESLLRLREKSSMECSTQKLNPQEVKADLLNYMNEYLDGLPLSYFTSRFPRDFKDRMRRALTKYLFTKETVISSKGYSLTTLTISRLVCSINA